MHPLLPSLVRYLKENGVNFKSMVKMLVHFFLYELLMRKGVALIYLSTYLY